MNVGPPAMLSQKVSALASASKSRLDTKGASVNQSKVNVSTVQSKVPTVQVVLKAKPVVSDAPPSPPPSPLLHGSAAPTTVDTKFGVLVGLGGGDVVKDTVDGHDDGSLSTDAATTTGSQSKSDDKSSGAAGEQLRLVLKALGKSKADVSNALRAEYAQVVKAYLQSIGDGLGSSFMYEKHSYTYKENYLVPISTGATPTTQWCINTVGQGSGMDQRLGLQVRNHYITVRMQLNATWLKEDIPITTDYPIPKCMLYIYRYKINLAPTTNTTINYVLGSQNPPNGENVLYEGLVSSTYGTQWVGVRNPVTMGTHEVYVREAFCPDWPKNTILGFTGPTAAGTRGSILPYPSTTVKEFKIPVHREVGWNDDGDVYPATNGVYLSVEQDVGLAAFGYRFSFTAQMCFSDCAT